MHCTYMYIDSMLRGIHCILPLVPPPPHTPQVYAARQPVDLEVGYPKAKRIVLRDVSRTDRNYHYFSHKRNLRKVHRILMIYSMFHPGETCDELHQECIRGSTELLYTYTQYKSRCDVSTSQTLSSTCDHVNS